MAMELTFREHTASRKPASDIFVINGTAGLDDGVTRLIALMQKQGVRFYQRRADKGLVSAGDVVIIKVNSQWDERGGTNTDLLKSLIQAILGHPDGFSGEIVVADNGQAQYGSTGKGGSFEYANNNAEDRSQSVQNVVDSFTGKKVSAYLWDRITTAQVREYSEGDDRDGYVVGSQPSPQTGALVSYPKFTTGYGTRVSFKNGVWDPAGREYDGTRLKLLNVPVLKTHFIYGVTASVKAYQGIVSDKLTAKLGARAHVTLARGGLGTEIAGTRLPTLNILDAIWVNARPRGGPPTPYASAERTNAIAASTEPVALDIWAAKNILMQVAREKSYPNLAHIDPDNIAPGSFGEWLRLATAEMQRAGLPVTDDESRVNVWVGAPAPEVR
jgi:hypothetical protein